MNNADGLLPNPADDPQDGHEDDHEDDHEDVAAGGLRLFVTIDGAGRPYGENTNKFSTLVGKLVRTHIPVKYEDWRKVPQFFKDEIWNGLMIKFTFGAPSCLVRPKVETTYSQKFRTYKNSLRKKLIGKVTTEDLLAAIPKGYHLPFWQEFIDNERKPESVAKRAKYKENSEKKVVRHTLGRLSYAQKSFNLQLKDGVIIDGRPEIWMEGHKGKNGVVHPSAAEKYEQVKNANEKRKNLAKAGDFSGMDFDNDAITDVFGPDQGKGYFRAFSSHLTKSQAATSTLAMVVNASKASSSEGPKEDSVLVDKVNKLSKDFHDFMARQQTNKAPYVDASSPSTVGSTSSAVDAMGNLENTDGKTQYVNVLNKKKKVAAKGFIMQGARMFHGQPLGADERRVQIETILDETCAVYDAPQGDDYMTFKDLLGVSTWLVWPLKRLEFVDE